MEKELAAILISLLSLLLSGYAIYYTHQQNKRARSESIQDHFWLREIVGDLLLKPFIAFTFDLNESLHDESQAQSVIEEGWNEHGKKIGRFLRSFQLLSIVDDDKTKRVLDKLAEFEDSVTLYYGYLIQYAVEKNTHAVENIRSLRNGCLHDCNRRMLEICRIIKSSQFGI